MRQNPPQRRKRAEHGEAELWRRATSDVAPLRPAEHRPPPFKPAKEPLAVRSTLPSTLRATLSFRSEPPLDSLVGIDRANAERLKRGQHPIEARLDLHGLTQAEAHRALSRFVVTSQAAGRRCVLVITGRGRLGEGVLRVAVPRWLAEPGLRRHLLAIAPAQPQHGGAGALYLWLRRDRQS